MLVEPDPVKPKKALTSVIVVGFGQCNIVVVLLGLVATLFEEIMCPKYST
jgi:hypothetical protein